MNTLKIGLLPLYLALYDQSNPELRPQIEQNYKTASKKLQDSGLEVLETPICRVEAEFAKAVRQFEDAKVDAIVTLHLAYSPSLESEQILSKTAIPLVILDTTPAYTYDQYTNPDELMFNHGIHGVMDLCNLLCRNGKPFAICAGHMEHSDVIIRTVRAVRAAAAVRALRCARVGLVGEPFTGMGDFAVDLHELEQSLGIQTYRYDFTEGAKAIAAISPSEIDAEFDMDCNRFQMDKSLSRSVYNRTTQTALALRKWYRAKGLTALTVNFLAAHAGNTGLPIMPFTECCTAMEYGLGYAGEGDVLTAAFVGALLHIHPETTFTEIFCPDWEHGSLFLSHMGEFNYQVSQNKPFLTEKPFPFTDAPNPTVAYGTLRGGKGVFANLAPIGNGRYRLTLSQGEVLEIQGENRMASSVNGWFRPQVPLESFLEQYSRAGATHHSALVYGEVLEELKLIASFLPCDITII